VERERWERTAQNVGELTRRYAELVGSMRDIRQELAAIADDRGREEPGSAYFSAQAARRRDIRDDDCDTRSVASRRYAPRLGTAAHASAAQTPARSSTRGGASAASTIPTGGRGEDKHPGLELLQPISLSAMLAADASEAGSPAEGPHATLKTWGGIAHQLRHTQTAMQPPAITTQAVPFPDPRSAGAENLGDAMRALADCLDARSGRGSVAAPSIDGDRLGGATARGGGYGGGNGGSGPPDGGGGGSRSGGDGGSGPPDGGGDGSRSGGDGGGVPPDGGGSGGGGGNGGGPSAQALRGGKNDDSGFDAEGYAIARMSPSLTAEYQTITVGVGDVHGLWMERNSLATRIRLRANELRQRQKPRWEDLRREDDFGCAWFEQTVYGVCAKITGSHPLVATVRQHASQWIHEGKRQTHMRDGELFEWFFTQLNLHFQDTDSSIAADTLRISLPAGASLQDFLSYFTTQCAISSSLNPEDDSLLVRGGVGVISRQFNTISGWVEDITKHPTKFTSQELIERLSKHIRGGHEATPPKLGRYPLFPQNFQCLQSSIGGSAPSAAPAGKPAPTAPAPKRYANTINQITMACLEICALTDRRNDSSRTPLDCYNCKGPHAFADCTAPLNKANWAAVVANRPYVGKFAPADEQQFADLRKRVRQSIASRSYMRSNGGRSVARPPPLP
jgi:hypothetical protein